VSGDVLPAVLGIALVGAAAVFALLPFARGRSSVATPSEPVDSAIDRFDLYQQVLELELDYQLGKLSAADFQELTAELLAQAGRALRDERDTLAAIDAEIECEIAAARAAFAAARRAGRTPAETVP
jgi:hypothetical protein